MDPLARTFNLMDYGAVPDGRTTNTDAIRKTIDACSASGGGTVHFPTGTYLTGPIQLASNVNLQVASGTKVVFSRDYDDYPLVPIRWQGLDGASCMPLLYGRGLENISITGDGIFDGSGDAWRPVKKFKLTQEQWEALVQSGGVVDDDRGMWWPTRAAMEGHRAVLKLLDDGKPVRFEDLAEHRDLLRPVMVGLHECRDVLLEGPTFMNPPLWTIHPLMCDDVTVRNIKVQNPWHASNGDGLNPDACRNVLIEDCFFSTGDDCIALNAGRDFRGRPCEDIVIRNCRMERGHGGVVIGSCMSGGVRRVHVHDCTFAGTDIGLRFKTVRGRGGTVEDIRIDDITMTGVRGEAVRFNMSYMVSDPRPEPVSDRTSRFRNFRISRIRCAEADTAIWMRGLGEMPIENVVFEDMSIAAENGISIEDARDITLKRVHVKAKNRPVLQCHNVVNLACDGFTHEP